MFSSGGPAGEENQTHFVHLFFSLLFYSCRRFPILSIDFWRLLASFLLLRHSKWKNRSKFQEFDAHLTQRTHTHSLHTLCGFQSDGYFQAGNNLMTFPKFANSFFMQNQMKFQATIRIFLSIYLRTNTVYAGDISV